METDLLNFLKMLILIQTSVSTRAFCFLSIGFLYFIESSSKDKHEAQQQTIRIKAAIRLMLFFKVLIQQPRAGGFC